MPERKKKKPAEGGDASIPAAPAPRVSNKPPPAPVIQKTHRPYRSAAKPSVNPRRVRGGVKLTGVAGPGAWASERIAGLIEAASAGEPSGEGVDYAKNGQTKRVDVEPGAFVAVVQGRMPRAYRVRLELARVDSASHDRVVAAMSDNTRLSAKVLAGDVPPEVDELFVELGLGLCPGEPGDLTPSCTCADWSKDRPWCKHALCAGLLMGEHIGRDPFALLALRGFEREDLLERMRDRRAMATQGEEPAPVYVPHVPGASGIRPEPLEADLESFWSAGPSLELVDAPLEPPATSHVLLRRLGPSPLPGRFPLVGLLATCYDLIGQAALDVDVDVEGEEIGSE